MELECINRVELRGIVGTSRVTEVGDRNIINFSLATNYAYRDREGTPLHIEGRIRNIRYTDANGCERTTLEVVASKVERVER